MNKRLLLMLLIILLLFMFIINNILGTDYFSVDHNNEQYSKINNNRMHKSLNNPIDNIHADAKHPIYFNEIRDMPVYNDIIRNYDYNKLYDPLEEPTRRVSRHEIHPNYLKQMIDYPTRGYPDNFSQMGILTRVSDDNGNNNIIRLFGRQEYPGSYKYEYYTMINSGHDQIKILLDIGSKKELYDGDTLYISELKNDYLVRLHKFDAPKYYPDII